MRPLPLALLLAALALSTGGHAADPGALPANLSGGLAKLVAWHLANAPTVPASQRRARMAADQPSAAQAQLDASASTATVDVRLDGTRPTAEVRAALEALGCTVLGTFDIARAGSILTVKLPLGRALEAARTRGVLSLVLAHKPRRHVGKITSQGAGVLKSTALNTNGMRGSGITVAVISDSYDRTTPRAADDIASGDLPASVAILKVGGVEQEGSPDDVDEGRAMLQIIHDVAPDATLAFATSGNSQTVFAQNVRALRADPTIRADVIVDDISFPDEPFFSDGPIAQAVEDVVTLPTSVANPGRPVAYFSSAGNDGSLGFDATFSPLSDADVRAKTPRHNLRLNSVPGPLTAGGFHNFGTPAAPLVTQQIKVRLSPASLDFQWDDPFVPTGNSPNWITTDYNVLVFTAAGAYLGELSGVDDNVATGQALEFPFLPPGARGQARTYQIAITRRATASPTATRLRYVVFTDGRFQATPFQRQVPTIYGHCGARGADGVGAYSYDALGAPNDFSSTGPLTIYFDRNGQRLAQPEVRQQPTISAPDNVDTTFFPSGPLDFTDPDKTGFPNFTGTSAAAPHAAAVAALLLGAKGGPGSRTAAQIRAALQGSVASHDLDPFFCRAVVTPPGSTVTLEASGDTTDSASSDRRFFRLTFTGPTTTRVTQVVINLAPIPLVFDPSTSLGLPFRVGAFSGIRKTDFAGTVGTILVAKTRLRKTLTVKLKNNSFAPGATLEFGIDRDSPLPPLPNGKVFYAGGNSADLLEGATVTVTTLDNNVSTQTTGTFTNSKGKGYAPTDGFGLIDAQAALNLLP